MDQSAIMNFFSAHQWIIPIMIAWSLAWKGVALWKSAQNKSQAWFVAILVINTLGILEIIYILFFSKEKIYPEESPASEESIENKVT
jgi:hypothetical protein